jgi:hypothetical protein
MGLFVVYFIPVKGPQSIVTFQRLHHAVGTCYHYHLSFASALDSWESELGVIVHLLECWWALRMAYFHT